MAKEVKKYMRIPSVMNDYISDLASFMKVSENDAIKMIIFESMNRTKFSVTKKEIVK